MASASSPAAASPSPKRQRNVGVLEVKMKQRLLGDRDAVAIGMLQPRGSKNGGRAGANARSPARKKPHKLPKLGASASRSRSRSPSLSLSVSGTLPAISTGAEAARPPSFETERELVMDALQLPSPTRSLIHKHVQHTKEATVKAQQALPPLSGVFKPVATVPPSLFPVAYRRNELPIMVEPKPGGKTLRWTQDVGALDLGKYLPLFIEGMREREYPFCFLAREGAFQLAAVGRRHPDKVASNLHRIVPALRANLETRDTGALFLDTLGMLQQLALVPGVGPMLVPYYRQLLPMLNVFKSRRRNLGDAMDFKQRSAKDVGEAVRETLELLERTGGEDAFVNIKYMVPTFEGCEQ